MLERIKRYCIKKGWRLPKTTYEKIYYILYSKIDLRTLYQIEEYFVLPDVEKYCLEFENILKQDLFVKALEITKVSRSTIPPRTFYRFLGVNGKIPVDPEEKIKKFCSLARSILYLFDNNLGVAKCTGAKGPLSYNMNLLGLHIIYIDSIIDNIYKCCQIEHKAV